MLDDNSDCCDVRVVHVRYTRVFFPEQKRVSLSWPLWGWVLRGCQSLLLGVEGDVFVADSPVIRTFFLK